MSSFALPRLFVAIHVFSPDIEYFSYREPTDSFRFVEAFETRIKTEKRAPNVSIVNVVVVYGFDETVDHFLYILVYGFLEVVARANFVRADPEKRVVSLLVTDSRAVTSLDPVLEEFFNFLAKIYYYVFSEIPNFGIHVQKTRFYTVF